MKPTIRIAIAIALIAALALPGLALAQDGSPDDQVVLGGSYTLASGDSVRNLNILGGNAVIEAGSTVTDDIFLFGGNLTIDGNVGEDIHVFGGQLSLGETAVVGGDISLAGGDLDRASGAEVDGSIYQTTESPFGFTVPEPAVVSVPRYWGEFDPMISQVFWFLTQTVGLAALAMLVILFAPKFIERAGDAAMARPWAAGGLGLLVGIITPPLLIGFAITIIGIPITLLLALVVSVLSTFGWIALGLEVGKRLAQAFRQDWPAVLSAGLGTLLLSLVANGIGLTPCVGWIVPTLVGFVGMGGVILSRLGTHSYPTAAPTAPVAVA